MKFSIVSLFSGIGSYEKALSNLGVDFNLVCYCEIDKKASQCYSLIHGVEESKNLWDIKEIDADNLTDIDLLTYSPPCQDISTIGTHSGISKYTRTGLMWETIKIIKSKKPKYLVMENVRNLVGKYKIVFDEYVKELESLGYKCYYSVMNAKDYGVPQNRVRLFFVGIRNDLNQKFEFSSKKKLKKHLRDYLKDIKVNTIERDIAYTIRVGGRKSKIGNKHNWDGYVINGKDYYLSGKDCLLLMGFDEKDYKVLIDAGILDSRVAKVAGNSVVVNILEDIFRNLIIQQ